MALFQTSVLKSHLALLDQPVVDKAYKKYQAYFLNAAIQEEIKKIKEEQYQATFLQELFVKILGYTLYPNPDANLITEFKNENNSRKADGAILKDGKAIGVIELKGTNTKDLESIRRQAFDYKANQKDCEYIITSNFEKLRFYINDATEFEEFDLFTLSRKRFNLLYLCLHVDKVLNHAPLKIKEASIAEEEQITKAFYKDYSVFKRELYRDLVKKNSKTVKLKLASSSNDSEHQNQDELLRLEKNVKLTLFKKSQKLIDRFLFIFFAEDRLLLPSNSTLQILNKWKDDWDFGDERSLYQLFKQYFVFLDQGRKGTEKRAEIYAYNGGLFKPDPILDALEIDNDLLYRHTLQLSNYDFESQVDVNILGHIFENSLNEIESVNAEIEGGNFDKQTSKRKKDGVFYTPKYITKYIVENTVGKLCDEKKTDLGFNEEEYFKGRKNRNKETIVNLVAILDAYREWLLQITICDPACGSGAFLNQALDFLIKEHAYIDELKTKILGGGLQFPDIENTILENNIYGVDLNEESVEIAKLSLWLRTAQPRRKLNDLSSNIKCGNSLIDSKAVAGDKAFKWESAFAGVFENGGFDVVIGNPPYVNIENINEKDKSFYSANYKTFFKRSDLFGLFIEQSYKKISPIGLTGLIVPSILLNNLSFSRLREELLEQNKLSGIISLGGDVFADATVDTIIVFIDGQTKHDYIKLVNGKLFDLPQISQVSLDYFNLFDKNISIEAKETISIMEKLNASDHEIAEEHFHIFQGVVTGRNDAFIFETLEDALQNGIEQSLLVPMCHGRDIAKWYIKEYRYLLYLDSSTNLNDFPGTRNWLDGFKEELSLRRECIKGVIPWYSLQWPRDQEYFYKNPKILIQNTRNESLTTRIVATLDTAQFFGTQGLNFIYANSTISIVSFLALLNSTLINYLFKKAYLNLAIKADYLKKIRFPNEINNQSFVDLGFAMTEVKNLLNKQLNGFLDFIKSSFSVINPSRKLESWHELSFADFIKELTKAIKKENRERKKAAGEGDYEEIPTLTKKDEFEWMELFEAKKKEALKLQSQITATEKEIDEMVYELYGLSEEEIAVVEGS